MDAELFCKLFRLRDIPVIELGRSMPVHSVKTDWIATIRFSLLLIVFGCSTHMPQAALTGGYPEKYMLSQRCFQDEPLAKEFRGKRNSR